MHHDKHRRGLLAWGGLMALTGMGSARAEPDQPAPPQSLAPDTPLGQTLDGKPLRLADFDGRPVIVFFWASWCPYCRNELPVLERLQSKTGERLPIIAINIEEKAVFKRVQRALAESTRITHTYDPNEAAAKAFAKPASLPYTLLLRGDGSVAARQSGWDENSVNFIVKHVNAVLAEAKAAEG
ncbi:TlpA family protein disulfide reductase [Roseateles cellulosilyticus]|uniref:TlpA family protein disulfide reductase n=1 Tax=Pelomonas cellulosilytica TaxID=2906762 RepID=A0ABS8Y4H8_9BURK|nr:TlpA disulfide reductase family protein [Pelomonas sp. P8]MCE4558149.1 TlpA family protein disulfide reductase [Pelomonas sp. P8]